MSYGFETRDANYNLVSNISDTGTVLAYRKLIPYNESHSANVPIAVGRQLFCLATESFSNHTFSYDSSGNIYFTRIAATTERGNSFYYVFTL